jgi:hypothetical protein
MRNDDHRDHSLLRISGGLIVGVAAYFILKYSPWGETKGIIFLSFIFGIGFALVGKKLVEWIVNIWFWLG